MAGEIHFGNAEACAFDYNSTPTCKIGSVGRTIIHLIPGVPFTLVCLIQ
jgi:hypothetical protein